MLMLKKFMFSSVFISISSYAYASSGGGGSLLSWNMLFKTINFLLLIYLLHRFARKPLANMLRSSAENTKKTIDEARSTLEETKKELADYQAKIANLENELKKRRESALASIEAEKNQLIEDARNQAKNIEEQAQDRMEQSILQAKAEIREFLVNESIKMAEESISKEIGNKEQRALLDNYTKFLKESA